MSKGNKRQERMVKFAYLRDERDPRRVMTIARAWGKNGNKMHYAYTICNPVEDQFRKATGRTEAVSRMESNPTKIRPEQGEFILRAIILDIATRNLGEDSSRNAIAMANQWLDEYDRRMEEDYLRCSQQEDNDESGCGDCDCNCAGSCQGCDPPQESDNEDEALSEQMFNALAKIRTSLGGGPMTGAPKNKSRYRD